MKKIFALALSLLLLLALAACSSKDSGPKEVTVFADASLSEALTSIAEQYKTAEPEVRILFSFGSSKALARQIGEGSHCDIFISAGQEPMDQADAGGFTDPDSRLDLLLDIDGGTYPAAMLKESTFQATVDFFTYLQSSAAMEIFSQAGFVAPEG